jgi:hypothetical protein
MSTKRERKKMSTGFPWLLGAQQHEKKFNKMGEENYVSKMG